MKKILALLAILSIALFATGCTPRTIVDDDSMGQAGVANAPGDEASAMDGGEPITDDISSTTVTQDASRLSDIKDRYQTSSEGVPEFGDILYEYDSYNIQPNYRDLLTDLAAWLINNNAILLVEGHCDERGTREYNIALGDRRALSVKDYLLASGVPDMKIESVSYGKERPLCREQGESCWSLNRRAHFVIEVVR